MTTSNFTPDESRKLSAVIARTWADAEFAALYANVPEAVLAGAGIDLKGRAAPRFHRDLTRSGLLRKWQILDWRSTPPPASVPSPARVPDAPHRPLKYVLPRPPFPAGMSTP